MEWKNEQVVLLCGGEGTRLREETEFKPKALVEIGGRPVLWHLMRYYASWGYRRFVLCLGYKGDMIKEYFLQYPWRDRDFTLHLKEGRRIAREDGPEMEDWEITFVETGEGTQTGGRLFRARQYVEGDTFLFNYSDGLSDIDLDALVAFHREQKTVATLTGVHPRSRYGVVRSEGGIVNYWREKPMMTDFASGGYFVASTEIFEHLDDACILEEGPLGALAESGQLSLFPHQGFWYSMDTYKEALTLGRMWQKGEAPWKRW